MANQDIRNEILEAEFRGKVIEKLDSIEKFINVSTADRAALHDEVDALRAFQDRQKVYLTVAIAMGGLVVGIVDRVLAYIYAIKLH